MDTVLSQAEQALQAILLDCPNPDWLNLLIPLERLSESLERTWSPIRHLHAVMDSPQLRTAYSQSLTKLNKFQTDLSQNETLYQALNTFTESADWQQLDATRQRLVSNILKEFRLGGVGLETSRRQRYKVLSARLAQCGTDFANNLLDATQAWSHQAASADALQGLPPMVLQQARERAQHEGLEGWLLGLDLPCYLPVMGFAHNRELRADMYNAYVTRASDCGPHAGQFDNTALMHEILELRSEKARLLGYGNYAELSLARKMAATPTQVLDFLHKLASGTKPFARKEFAKLCEFAAADGCAELQPYDIAYYAEKLKQRDYAFNQEDVRPYFPANRVIDGLFELSQQLFNICITPSPDAETWHRDVQYFQLHDPQGALLGGFFLDMYARKGKRGGAWMDVCRNRMDLGNGLQLPIAYLTCNFTAPGQTHDALLSHEEVTTLFHEFGHGLHHLLSRIDLPGISGINGVEWDAVELPSQFMENWCYEPRVLKRMSGHFETGQPLPEDLIEKLRAARTFHSGLQMLRQIEFSLFDFRLHLEYHSGIDIQALAKAVHDEIAVVPQSERNRFANSFSHIFDGGYARGLLQL